MSETEPQRAGVETLRSLLWEESENPARKALRDLLEHFRERLGLDRVSVSINQPAETGFYLHVVAEVGIQVRGRDERSAGQRRALHQARIPLPKTLTVRQEILEGPDTQAVDALLLRAGIHSYAILPLMFQGSVIGSLNMGSRALRYFTAPVLAKAQEMAEVVATAAHHVALFSWNDRQSRLLAITKDLIDALSPYVRVREASQHLSRFLGQQMEAARASLFVLNEERTWLTCESLYERENSGTAPIGLLPSLSVEAIPFLSRTLRGEPVALDRSSMVSSLTESVRKRLELERTSSALLVPLMHGDAPVGIVFLQWDETGPIIPEHAMSVLRFLGQQVGFLLHTRQIAANRERSARSFSGLVNMSHVISAASDLSQVPEIVARQARDICEADESTLLLLEPDGVTLRPVVCLSEWAEEVLSMRLKVGEGITGTVAARRRGEIINHAESDPRSVQVPGTPLEPEAILAAPLVSADHLVGVLTLHKLEGRMFDPMDLDTLEIFASQAAIAIENARLFTRIREERTRLVTMLEQMEEGVVFVSQGGKILLMNAAGRRMLHLPEADYTGHPIADFLKEPRFHILDAALARVIAGEKHNVTEECAINGRTYLCSVSAVTDRGQSEHSGEVLLFKDMTELKQIETQLLQTSKMSAVGQLAAGVAHEFNNLIASIYGYAQFMREHQDPKTVSKGVDIILRSSERARELTSSLLTFSRRRAGRREPVDVNQILTDTLLLLNRQFEKSRIKVTRGGDKVPLTVADAGRLQQVFLNILVNAQQAMTEGGEVQVLTRSEGDTLEVVIADNGPGIPAENLPRVFEPFFTTKGALSGASVPGVGLGLSTAYNIIRDHGGTVTATSEPGRGATFVVRIPVRNIHEPEHQPPGPRVPRSLDFVGRILVVENDPEVMELLTEILRNLGHKTLRAEDGHRAIRLLAHGSCDLVVLEFAGLGDQARQVFRELRQSHPQLPILLVTNRDTQQVVEAEGDPWVFRINKPFRNRDLVALVSRIFTQRLQQAG